MGKSRFWAWLWLSVSLTLGVTLNLLDVEPGVEIPYQLLAIVLAVIAIGPGLTSKAFRETLALSFLTGLAYGVTVLIQEIFENRTGEYFSWALRFADKTTWFDWALDTAACTTIAVVVAASAYGLKAMTLNRAA